ncbi:MAG TPA: nucleotide disphospho-sugar-binding domain-containing protein [Nocardioides sp.]|uniref:nucleotide disphospho-sugar-binding domain-containing protein n=1 Tax=Nocardioides sp. TaxID=35761 RepID=UPI002E341670|nr:nucleotide disphospho-sugar-binding domain-containing protein [Nocardioides sp.]HEX5088052.1 nucleotide disphospho-sugar-binding domain-containing protein [Nocardioides sp.]
MSDILFVTWDGGGNVPPALGIARELQARGHSVRFLGHAGQASALTAAGFEVEPTVHARRFEILSGYTPLAMLGVFADRGMGQDMLAALRRRPADLVVVDSLMFGAMRAAADAEVPFVVLEHSYASAYQKGVLGGPMGLNLWLRRLRPRQALDRAAARLLTTIPSLDPVASPPPNQRRIGPVVDVEARQETSRPMVLVSLSTVAFARMRPSLQAILDATRDLDADVVATTGPAIDPAELVAPPGVELRRFVPHVELMPRASLLVGHGGHGTTMQALAHDLPVAVMPMDRLTDQPYVGRSLVAAGAGRMLRKGAAADRIAPELAALLADGPHRAAAARLGAEVRSLPGATLGADAVEELLRDGASVRDPRAARQ